MNGVAAAAAFALAGVFAWAACAKLARPAATTTAFRRLGLPAAPVLARAVPAIELLLGGLLVFRPRAGGGAALALLAVFTAFLATRLARGEQDVGCGCFGGSRTTRLAPVELVRNGLLMILSVVALGTARPVAPGLPEVLTVGAAVAIGVVLLGLVDLRVNTGSVWGGAGGEQEAPQRAAGRQP